MSPAMAVITLSKNMIVTWEKDRARKREKENISQSTRGTIRNYSQKQRAFFVGVGHISGKQFPQSTSLRNSDLYIYLRLKTPSQLMYVSLSARKAFRPELQKAFLAGSESVITWS